MSYYLGVLYRKENMKYICTIVCALIILSSPLAAKKTQADTTLHGEKIETLFGSDGFTNGGFGAFEMKPGAIGGSKVGLFLGGRGGWIINHVFSIGGGGYGLVTKPELHKFTVGNVDTTLSLQMGYGGLVFEYTYNPQKAFHFTVNTLIGAGGVSYVQINDKNKDNDSEYNWDNNLGKSTFFVVEPSITAELNVLTYFRIAIGASYRFVSGVDLTHYSNNTAVATTTSKDLSGFNGVISFKFGKF